LSEFAYTEHDLPERERAISAELEQRDWEEDDTRVLPDPKPTKRYRASRKEWAHMRRVFSTSRCLVCAGEWTELHHVLPRDGGGPYPCGDDVVVNVAPLCAPCHRKVEARDPEALAALRANLNDAHKWYLTYRLGHAAPAWLDRHLPELLA